jgi:hypothetical protein
MTRRRSVPRVADRPKAVIDHNEFIATKRPYAACDKLHQIIMRPRIDLNKC